MNVLYDYLQSRIFRTWGAEPSGEIYVEFYKGSERNPTTGLCPGDVTGWRDHWKRGDFRDPAWGQGEEVVRESSRMLPLAAEESVRQGQPPMDLEEVLEVLVDPAGHGRYRDRKGAVISF